MSISNEGVARSGVRAAILDAAAEVIADRGEAASVSDIIAAAGVGRATLYRYFSSREALLTSLTSSALEDLGAAITAAELDSVDVGEGLARLSRAIFRAADRYAALMKVSGKYIEQPEELERQIVQPIRELLQRGIDEGILRPDVPLELQLELLAGLYEKGMVILNAGKIGAEGVSALITNVFLRGVAAEGH